MNIDDKDELPIQSFRFDVTISNGRLRTLLRDAEVIRIERGPWHCFVEFRSTENARVLEKKVKDWYDNFREEQNAAHQRKHDAIYDKRREEMIKNPSYLPATCVHADGRVVEGYMYLDDNDKWHYVYPDDPPKLRLT